jgi:hypothetical protein
MIRHLQAYDYRGRTVVTSLTGRTIVFAPALLGDESGQRETVHDADDLISALHWIDQQERQMVAAER